MKTYKLTCIECSGVFEDQDNCFEDSYICDKCFFDNEHKKVIFEAEKEKRFWTMLENPEYS